MARQQPFTIDITGLRDLRRDLRKIEKGLPRELNVELKRAMEPVAASARSLAPKRTGRLAASIKPFAAGNRAGIRSGLPYANPIHWGWRARGIKGQPFAHRAVEDHRDGIVDDLADAFNALAVRHGFRRF